MYLTMNRIMSFTTTTSIISNHSSTIRMVGKAAKSCMGKECMACKVDMEECTDGTTLTVISDYARRKSFHSFSFFYFYQPFINSPLIECFCLPTRSAAIGLIQRTSVRARPVFMIYCRSSRRDAAGVRCRFAYPDRNAGPRYESSMSSKYPDDLRPSFHFRR